MTLALTESERELLLETLRDRLGTVRQQIHHSTTSTFTDQLKAMESALRVLIAKLESGMETPAADEDA